MALSVGIPAPSPNYLDQLNKTIFPLELSQFLPNTENTMNRLKQAVSDHIDSNDIMLAIESFWLRKLTSYGFCQIPPVREDIEVMPASKFHIINDAIKWTTSSSNKIFVSAHGYSFAINYKPRIKDLLLEISTNIGATHRVDFLSKKYQIGMQLSIRLVKNLYRIRVVNILPPQ